MRSIILFVLLVMMVVSAGAQKKKEASNAPAGINYCLPKVNYRVEVVLEHIKIIPGPYQKYAEKELGLKPEMFDKEETWEIKDIIVTPQSVPDENAMFSVSVSGDYHALLLALSVEGFLAGVAGGGKEVSYEDPVMYYSKDDKKERRLINRMHLNTLKEVLDTNYTYQEVDNVMKKIWDPIVKYVPKGERDNVEEAVSEIFRIRSERMDLLEAGSGVPDGKALEILLKELGRMEEGYLSLFIGKREVHRIIKVFDCVLDKADEPVVVFRFSKENGIVNKRDVSAIAYMLQLENVVTLDSSPSRVSASEVQPGIYYRVPAIAELKLMKGTEELATLRAIVPQLGSIKKFPMDVIINEGLSLELYPKYGSLKSVSKNK